MVPLAAVQEATHRLIRSVDHMADEEYAAPSLLPGWSRGHVVAHLTLNAEGLAAALDGVARGRPIPMYASVQAREDDIAELATAATGTLRTRLLGATTDFATAVNGVSDDSWGIEIERTPDGVSFLAGDVTGMRDREVEIHHADLGLAYTHTSWPMAFSARLLDMICDGDAEAPFWVHAIDLDQRWQCGHGEGGVTVSGAAADLGWWLSGRGAGEGLTSDDGVLPRIEDW
jgi:maleylpyruvate isomerase